MEGSSSSEVTTDKTSSAQSNEDEDFELTAEMMIHDFDDESTLNTEEDDENEDELADLEREGEMPLEELMAKYYSGNSEVNSDDEEEEDCSGVNATGKTGIEETLNANETRRTLRSSAAFNHSASDSESSDDGKHLSFHESEWKKPRIGDEYQVTEIPEVQPQGGEIAFHKDDEQVWVPWNISADVVEQFLKDVTMSVKEESYNPEAEHIQDNEDALFVLKQSNNNAEEALKRFRSRPNALNNEIHVWSEDECQQFELGLTLYGKDFHMIHLNKVKTKSVRDIIKFYYMWKKSERYDRFTAKTRLGKRKENLHPDVTDYMDRLLDETDNAMASILEQGASSSYMNAVPHSHALLEHLHQMRAAHASVDLDDVQHNTVTSHPLQTNTNNNCQMATSASNASDATNACATTSTSGNAPSTSQSLPVKDSSSEHEIPRKRPKLWEDSSNFSKVYNNEMGLTN